jgi:hypothetical protein
LVFVAERAGLCGDAVCLPVLIPAIQATAGNAVWTKIDKNSLHLSTNHAIFFIYLVGVARFDGSFDATKGDLRYMNRVWVLLLAFGIAVRPKFSKFLKSRLTGFSLFRYNHYMFYRLNRKVIDSKAIFYARYSISFNRFSIIYPPPPPITYIS